jgi:hypothetical protein
MSIIQELHDIQYKQMLEDLLPTEKYYPVYNVRVKWTQDDGDKRINNGTGWYRMEKQEIQRS